MTLVGNTGKGLHAQVHLLQKCMLSTSLYIFNKFIYVKSGLIDHMRLKFLSCVFSSENYRALDSTDNWVTN